jgi:peptidoglycan/LPS O-acetylase OafA/YrhL
MGWHYMFHPGPRVDKHLAERQADFNNSRAGRRAPTIQVPSTASAPGNGKGGLHIPSLDGIRALSFGLVFAGHAGLNSIVPAAFGVTVFFFLSGYLITTLLRMEMEKTGGISLTKFYLRRALRILPPFYLVFALVFAAYLAGLIPAATEPGSIRSVLLHYANFYVVNHGDQGFLSGTGVYWSLAVEEHFYLIFPCLYLLIATTAPDRRSQAIRLLVLCAVALAWRCFLHFGLHASEHRTHVASDARFDSLLFGCALALYENPSLDRSGLSERVWKYGLFPAGVAGLLVCFAIRNESFRETFRYSIQGLSLIPVFVCAVRYPEWLVMRPLNTRVLAFVGVLSYSLYLSHLFILDLVARHTFGLFAPGGVIRAAVALLLSLLVSWLMYRIVEKPCARLRKKLHG